MKRLFILVAWLCASTWAAAQKLDAAFVIGGAFVSDITGTAQVLPSGTVTETVETGNSTFFEGALGIRLLNAHVAALYVELPVAGIPSQPIKLTREPGGAIDHVGTVFVTPGIRVKLAPAAFVSPWASIGGGWGHYSLDTFGASSSKPAIQFGAGADFKTGIPMLALRAEARDYGTGDPDFGIPGFSPRGHFHHNVLAGGGIVLRF